MHINYLNVRLFLQEFTKFGDIYIHASGVEIGVVSPNHFEGVTAAYGFAHVLAEESEEFGFLHG